MRRAICVQNRPTSGAIGVSAYPTTVPGRKANPVPPPVSNRSGAGMTAWSIGPSYRAASGWPGSD